MRSRGAPWLGSGTVRGMVACRLAGVGRGGRDDARATAENTDSPCDDGVRRSTNFYVEGAFAPSSHTFLYHSLVYRDTLYFARWYLFGDFLSTRKMSIPEHFATFVFFICLFVHFFPLIHYFLFFILLNYIYTDGFFLVLFFLVTNFSISNFDLDWNFLYNNIFISQFFFKGM